MIEPTPGRVHGPAGELVVWEHAGDGPATLLLHGIGHAGRQWDYFARAVDGRLHLFAPDARGHGDSAKPNTTYAPADFVADVEAILDSLGLARVYLVGHSMGGAHALAFTLAHPERVSRLVVIDTGPSLVVRGTHGCLGAETARRMVEALPDARLLELDAGHNVQLDRPAELADAVVAFGR